MLMPDLVFQVSASNLTLNMDDMGCDLHRVLKNSLCIFAIIGKSGYNYLLSNTTYHPSPILAEHTTSYINIWSLQGLSITFGSHHGSL